MHLGDMGMVSHLHVQDLRPQSMGIQGIHSAKILTDSEAVLWVCTPANPFKLTHRLNKQTNLETLTVQAHRARLSKLVFAPLPTP